MRTLRWGQGAQGRGCWAVVGKVRCYMTSPIGGLAVCVGFA